MGSNPLLVKTYTAMTDIEPRMLVKFVEGGVARCAGIFIDKPIGVSGQVGAKKGEQIDIIRAGIAEVQLGTGMGAAPPNANAWWEVGALNSGQGYLITPTGQADNRPSVGFLEAPPPSGVVDGAVVEVFIRPLVVLKVV